MYMIMDLQEMESEVSIFINLGWSKLGVRADIDRNFKVLALKITFCGLFFKLIKCYLKVFINFKLLCMFQISYSISFK